MSKSVVLVLSSIVMQILSNDALNGDTLVLIGLHLWLYNFVSSCVPVLIGLLLHLGYFFLKKNFLCGFPIV